MNQPVRGSRRSCFDLIGMLALPDVSISPFCQSLEIIAIPCRRRDIVSFHRRTMAVPQEQCLRARYYW
jgi:hypothetical protein